MTGSIPPADEAHDSVINVFLGELGAIATETLAVLLSPVRRGAKHPLPSARFEDRELSD